MMSLWNPYNRGFLHYPPVPHHAFGEQFLHAFDSPFEIPSQLLTELTRERPLQHGRTTEIINNEKEFKINLPVENYKPEDLNVKLVRDQFLVIDAKKLEKREQGGDEGFVTGVVTEEFTRCFVIPKGVDLQNLKTRWNRDGTLVIQAPKIEVPAVQHERQLMIEYGD